MVLTDAFLEKLYDGMPVVVKGKKYLAVRRTDFAVGDVVLDREDGLHGTIDYISENMSAIRDGMFVQVGVPLTRLVKLEKTNEEEIPGQGS